ncbi:MAG: fibronectin type III domain-containing protein, partial [bacterium]
MMNLSIEKRNLFLMLACFTPFLLWPSSAPADNNKDFIMISLGDSYASGEGAPNAAATSSHGPAWNDVVCHRSDNAPAILAFKKLKAEHPGVSFGGDSTGRLIHFACSGAGVDNGILGPQRYDNGDLRVRTAQIQMVHEWMESNYPQEKYPLRKIDALIIDIGGNDANFQQIVKWCLLPKVPSVGPVDVLNCSTRGGEALFSAGIFNLTKPDGLYHRLVGKISQLPYVANVYVTEYPDPTHDASGNFCDSLPFPDFVGLTGAEARWAAQTVVAGLNKAIENLVKDANRRSPKTTWHMIRGISSQYANHGICSDANYVRGRPQNRFVNTLGDSLLLQSDSRCDLSTALARFMDAPARSLASDPSASLADVFGKSLVGDCDYNGTMHPNAMGYLAYRDPIVASMLPLFDRPATPDTFRRDFMNQTSIQIRWTDKSINEDVFEIRYHTSNNNEWKYDSLPWGSTSWTLSALTPGETYTFELRSCSHVLGTPSSCSDWTNLTV